jgi:hypothetical protein
VLRQKGALPPVGSPHVDIRTPTPEYLERKALQAQEKVERNRRCRPSSEKEYALMCADPGQHYLNRDSAVAENAVRRCAGRSANRSFNPDFKPAQQFRVKKREKCSRIRWLGD